MSNKTDWPLTPSKLNARSVTVEEVIQQLRATPGGKREVEHMIWLRQACAHLSGPILADLYKFIKGGPELTKDQVRSAEIILDRAIPKMQAIQVKHETDDLANVNTEADVMTRLKDLITQHPELVPLIDGAIGRNVVEGEYDEEIIDSVAVEPVESAGDGQ